MNHIFFILLSLVLLAFSLFTFDRENSSASIKALFLLMILASLSLFCLFGVSNYFTGKGINEAVIYHIRYGVDGAGFLEYRFLIIGSASALAASAILSCLFVLNKLPVKYKHVGARQFPYISLLLSLVANPASVDIYGLIPKYSIFATESSKDEVFRSYYKEPRLLRKIGDKKNLVYIYAESFERTYFDENLFPGLIKGLKELEGRSTYFTNISQVDGTGWTMGGITASQFGIPLITPSHGNSMSGMDAFLPAAIGIGELLSSEGYHLAYMGGASLDFGGKGKLFSSHGFDEVLGRDELIPRTADQSYVSSWGLYDDSLFELVYDRFLELSASGKNFGLYTLTLDTHSRRGHTSKSVQEIEYGDGSNSMLNTVAQSDRLLTNFINKIIESPYGDNTVIVLASDHLAMENTATDILKNIEEKRRNIFMVIEPNSKNELEVQSPGSTLDIAPTILPFLGFEGEVGLGRNLLSDTRQIRTELSYIQENIRNWKTPLSRFWDFPRIQGDVEIDLDNEIIHIENRSFRFPILIEIDDELETVMKFQFNRSYDHKSLIDHLATIDNGKSFILIDECENARNLPNFNESLLTEPLCENGFYIAIGKNGRYSKIEKIRKNTAYAHEELNTLINFQFKALRIAHAGGEVNNSTYTNSLEALNLNIKRGFLYFELDFSFTSDGNLVCLHDWEDSFKRSFGFETDEKVSLEEFKSLVKTQSRFNKCTLDGLARWMSKNPSAYIVTDVKEDNLKALELMMNKLPDARNRVIPQIYRPENFNQVKELGYNQFIWTLYRYPLPIEEVLDWTDRFYGPFAIAMSTNRGRSGLAMELSKKGVPTYAHTINSIKEMKNIINDFEVTEIYTDSIYPDRNLFDRIRDLIRD